MSKYLITSANPNLGESQFSVYEAENGQVKIDVRLEDEPVWLTQQLMADLFQTTKQNVGQHLKNVFSEGELSENSVVKKFFTTAADGKKFLMETGVIWINQTAASEGDAGHGFDYFDLHGRRWRTTARANIEGASLATRRLNG